MVVLQAHSPVLFVCLKNPNYLLVISVAVYKDILCTASSICSFFFGWRVKGRRWGCIGKKGHLILVIFYFLPLGFFYVILGSSHGPSGRWFAKMVTWSFPHPCMHKLFYPSEGTPLLLPWSLGGPSVTECGRSDAVKVMSETAPS